MFNQHFLEARYLLQFNELQDDNLYVNRWKELIAMPAQPDFIQIVSWNDYGESHYIGPMAGSPPAGTNWL
jgi:glucan endo-1,3-alpha-glucosidase